MITLQRVHRSHKMGDFLINQQKAILSPAGTEVAVAEDSSWEWRGWICCSANVKEPHTHTKSGSGAITPSGKARGHLQILWNSSQKQSRDYHLLSPVLWHHQLWFWGSEGKPVGLGWIIVPRKCSFLSWSCLNLSGSSNFGLEWLNLKLYLFIFLFYMCLPKEWSVFKQSFSQLLTLISKLILEKQNKTKLSNMLILPLHQIINTVRFFC